MFIFQGIHGEFLPSGGAPPNTEAYISAALVSLYYISHISKLYTVHFRDEFPPSQVGTLALKGTEVSQPEYEPADEAKVADDEGLSVNVSVADSDQPEVEPSTLEHEAEKAVESESAESAVVGDLETPTSKRSTVRTLKEAAQASTSEAPMLICLRYTNDGIQWDTFSA